MSEMDVAAPSLGCIVLSRRICSRRQPQPAATRGDDNLPHFQ